MASAARRFYQVTLLSVDPLGGEVTVQLEAPDEGSAVRAALTQFMPRVARVRKLTPAEAARVRGRLPGSGGGPPRPGSTIPDLT